MNPTNLDRADWAEKALFAFAKVTRQDRDLATGDPECFREVMQDLFTDLMHLADSNGIDLKKLLADAQAMHAGELSGEL